MGLENQDAVAAIDTHTNTVMATIPVGQQPQALVYVPDAVPQGHGTTNLSPLAPSGDAVHLADLLEAAVSGLKPETTYTLWLATSRSANTNDREALDTFKTNISGAQVVQAIAPLRRILVQEKGDLDPRSQRRFLLVTEADNNSLVLIDR